VERCEREAVTARYLDAAEPRRALAAGSTVIVGVPHREGDDLVTPEVEPGFERRGIGSPLPAHGDAAGVRTLAVRAFDRNAIALCERRGWRRVTALETSETGVPAFTDRYRRAD
jgi:hypothetical protein